MTKKQIEKILKKMLKASEIRAKSDEILVGVVKDLEAAAGEPELEDSEEETDSEPD